MSFFMVVFLYTGFACTWSVHAIELRFIVDVTIATHLLVRFYEPEGLS